MWVALVCALGGLATSTALGQTVPIPVPTVSTPTVSVPSVTVPSVTVPPVTTPAPGPSTPPVKTPSTTTPSVQAGAGGASVGGSGGSSGSSGGAAGGAGSGGSAAATSGSSGSSGSSGASAAGGSSAAGSSGASTTRLRSTRWWIAVRGSQQRRTTTLKFRLGRNGLVQFTVLQVSPVCRLVGAFRVHGHAGVNRVRFGGRVQGTQLSAGTYRITARTRAGRVIAVTTLVVVDARAPSIGELAFARRSNVCGTSAVFGSAGARGSFAPGAGGNANREASTIVRHQRASGKPSHHPSSSGGNGFPPIASEPLRAIENAKSPIVIALLGLAALMLGLAALPRAAITDPPMMGLVASHRVELATAGTAALLAAVVAMLLV